MGLGSVPGAALRAADVLGGTAPSAEADTMLDPPEACGAASRWVFTCLPGKSASTATCGRVTGKHYEHRAVAATIDESARTNTNAGRATGSVTTAKPPLATTRALRRRISAGLATTPPST